MAHLNCIIMSYVYSALQTSQPSYIRQLLSIQPLGFTCSSSYFSLSRPLISASIKFCNRSLYLSALNQLFGTDSQKSVRQFAHPPNPTLNFTAPPTALSSAAFHSRLKNSSSCKL